MWNGAPGSRMPSATSSTPANGSTSVKAPSVTAWRWAKSITGRTHVEARGDAEDVLGGAELADAAHDLDPERDDALLRLEPLAQRREIRDDRVERLLAAAAEQEAGMEDDDLGADRDRDAGGVVEHPEGALALPLVAREVAGEGGDRRVDGEGDPGLARGLAEAPRPIPTRASSRSRPRSRSRTPCSRARRGARRPPRGSRGSGRAAGRSGSRPRCSVSVEGRSNPADVAVSDQAVTHLRARRR